MLLGRLYPSGRLTEEDYEFLRDTQEASLFAGIRCHAGGIHHGSR